MCTVRHSKTHAGPSRTKDRSCSRKVWFYSMITRVHTWPMSHTQKGPSLSGSSLTIYPTAQTCCPVIPMCLISWKIISKGSASTRTMNTRTLWRIRPRHNHRNSGSMESFGLSINGIVVFRPMMHTLNKVFFYTHCVILYLIYVILEHTVFFFLSSYFLIFILSAHGSLKWHSN